MDYKTVYRTDRNTGIILLGIFISIYGCLMLMETYVKIHLSQSVTTYEGTKLIEKIIPNQYESIYVSGQTDFVFNLMYLFEFIIAYSFIFISYTISSSEEDVDDLAE
ncbi:hypothetical protein RF11_01753 [Thelohanellus kitauei]|uniref:Uncharacterized protein n=1 Tax=Thelohanellus kitauei TaxID=669202 RepID=A0A0C2MHA5_THEKT|nr:hypothetical protein RF11_01753 [Thelohanellus kitauei]